MQRATGGGYTNNFISFTGCTKIACQAPAFSSLTIADGGWGYSINFSGLTGLTGAPSFPALSTLSGSGSINFSGCTGLDGTAVFSALQTISGSVNFSGCTGLTGITLENCVASAANWGKFNLTNMG
ncbi:MAG: hypothetical protein LBL30_04650 [Holosporales bacterium]|nr:hypothetical protein [Holosporales bacterium]